MPRCLKTVDSTAIGVVSTYLLFLLITFARHYWIFACSLIALAQCIRTAIWLRILYSPHQDGQLFGTPECAMQRSDTKRFDILGRPCPTSLRCFQSYTRFVWPLFATVIAYIQHAWVFLRTSPSMPRAAS
jgi:hypothetical protein